MKHLLMIIVGTILMVPIFAESWTVLVYMAADNNLWQNAVQDVNDMESVELPGNLDIIVQTDMPEDSTYPGGQRRKIRTDSSSAITSTILADLGSVDSGDPQTLKSFINWGFQHYPAQRKMLIIWGHGDNWFKQDDFKWICPDYDSQTLLSVADGDLREALSDIPQLDILLFDACSMQSLEVLAEVMDAADYVVGSEELVPATGFPYQTMVPLFASGNVEQVATQIAQKYLESYQPGGIQNPNSFTAPITCSVIMTSEVADFYMAFKDYFLSGPLYSYQILLTQREFYWEMNTGFSDVDVGELLNTYAGWGYGIDELIARWEGCTSFSGSLNIPHQVGSAAVWFPFYRQYFETWWAKYSKLKFADYRWLSVLFRAYGNPDEQPPKPILLGQNMVLSNLVLDVKQPAFPDSLSYFAYFFPSNVGDKPYHFTPDYAQDSFRTVIPISQSGWITLYSADVWGNISDSTTVVLEYSEPQMGLLIFPNPIKDRELASVKWFLPEGVNGVVELTISNVRGQKVLFKTFEQTVAGEGIWLLSAESTFYMLGRGIYILEMSVGNKHLQRKLTIL